MNDEKRTRLISISIAIATHVLLVLLLILFGLPHIVPEEESGVLVMVGEVEMATGNEPPAGESMQPTAEAPDVRNNLPAETATPTPTSSNETPMISQNSEEAPTIAPKKKEEKKTTAPPVSEAERQRQEEARKAEADRKAKALQEAETEKQRKAEETRKQQESQRINNLIANAMKPNGAGGTAANHGTSASGNGAQGAPNGNSLQGATHGTPGWGSYDLGGRGMRGSLPRPSFDVNASGIVVVSITVDAAGNVTGATINPKGTNTSNASLRNAALSAARKAKFDSKDNANIQYGTITYRFDSDN